MRKLELEFDGPHFGKEFPSHILNTPDRSAFDIVNGRVQEQLEAFFAGLVVSGDIVRYKVEYRRPPMEFERYPYSLKTILAYDPICLGDYRLTVVVSSDVRISTLAFENLDCQDSQIDRKQLKTIYKYVVYLYGLSFSRSILEESVESLPGKCDCASGLLLPCISGVWDWKLRFLCKVCGKTYNCSCFRKAYDMVGLSLDRLNFRDGICHLCRGVSSDLFFCHPNYGSQVMVNYGPYIYSLATAEGINHREAENVIRDRLGIPRIGEGWVSEMELLHIVRGIFTSEKVEHQASPAWLGRQRFDIFIPGLRLAIEYQGQQHYDPIAFFGGSEGLAKTRERDKRKALLSKENRVTLVYFRYDEQISLEVVKKRLEDAL